MMTEIMERAVHYRHKVEEVRTIAECMAYSEPRRSLMTVANDDDMLARSIELTLAVDPIPASEWHLREMDPILAFSARNLREFAF